MSAPPETAVSSDQDAELYQGIVDAAVAVTGARYVNLAWLEPGGWVRSSVWAITDAALVERALTAARFVVPGFDPMAVRFKRDVNAAVRRVFVDGRSHFAPYGEHVEGAVHPLVAGLGQSVLGLEWTLSVPLVASGAVAGALAFHWPHRPHPRSLGVAEAFSAQAALTVENHRLSETLRARAKGIERSRERSASAAEETRREIAQKLDRVGSRILVATQRLLGCRALLAVSPAYVGAELSSVVEELDRLREDEVRAASHRLHPSLIGVGLVPALETLSDSFAELDVRVAASRDVSALDDIARNALPASVRLAVYRFAEEALGEIAARGGAPAAVIDLAIRDSALRATVVAEGGRAVPALPERTVRALRDRIERVEGAVEVDASPGATRVTAVVPLPAARRASAAGGAPSDLFQSIADYAVGATGARMVSLSWYDAAAGAHQLGAVAPSGALTRMVTAARKVVPSFDPDGIRIPVDVNPAIRTVLVDGRSFLAPTADHAEGMIPVPVLKAASKLLGFKWTYSVPLRVDGRIAGALAFHFADRPTSAALAVADVFASQAALTLANGALAVALRDRASELAASLERVAAAEERVRREIAESLHGRVQSRLLVVAHRLLEARGALASDPAAVASALDALAHELDRIRELDLAHAIDQLHPPVLSVGLMPALRHLAEELGPKLDVAVTADPAVDRLDDPAGGRVSGAIRLGVYRVVQEALANVARHAGVGAASVHVELAGGGLRASVWDAGRGFDPGNAREGVGLRSMRDRAERLGGTLSIDGRLGRGTTVTLTLPLGRDL